jgi:FKBP-type peptidyl-prolyl cis-trans isomerase SlyD
MRIDRDTVVTLAYELKDCDGELLEDEGATLSYLHGGYGGIFPKVENALQGGEVGHEVNLTLEPEDAFGDYEADLLRVEPRGLFPETLEVGMRFEGVRLWFKCAVKAVRKATDEELEHGHVHGEDGLSTH